MNRTSSWRRLFVGSLSVMLAVLALFLAPVPLAHAATITVRAYSDGVATPGNCPGANCRLRDAIDASNPGDKITFSSGGHTIALTEGHLTVDKDLTIFFVGSVGDIVIDAQSASRAFDISSGVTVTIDTLAIINGEAASGYNGGAIHVASDATLNLNNVSIQSSQVVGSGDLGGAIYNNGTLNITNYANFLSNQTASDGYGGAIYNKGTATLSGNVTGDSSRSIYFYSNHGGYSGGSIYNEGTLTVTNVQIIDGNALSGGAIFNNGTLKMYQSLVSGNTATGAVRGDDGGGIGNSITGTLTIADSLISSNDAGTEGGGISSEGTMTILRSLVYNNTAGLFGGGIFNQGTMTLINTTISANSTTVDGGGIFNNYYATLNNVTITKNVADSDNDGVGDGGGISDNCSFCAPSSSSPTTIIYNSIISGNQDTPNNGGPGNIYPGCAATLDSHGYNLFYVTTGCTISDILTGNITGQSADLESLANNGGSTETHALKSTSPAINAGNPATPGSGGDACASNDQRHYSRGGGAGRCDMGAFERVLFLFLPLILK
jgi:predicted outer membrane repeat protein